MGCEHGNIGYSESNDEIRCKNCNEFLCKIDKGAYKLFCYFLSIPETKFILD